MSLIKYIHFRVYLKMEIFNRYKPRNGFSKRFTLCKSTLRTCTGEASQVGLGIVKYLTLKC